MDMSFAFFSQVSNGFEDVIKTVFQFIKPVPPGIIRGHHGSSHSRTTQGITNSSFSSLPPTSQETSL